MVNEARRVRSQVSSSSSQSSLFWLSYASVLILAIGQINLFQQTSAAYLPQNDFDYRNEFDGPQYETREPIVDRRQDSDADDDDEMDHDASSPSESQDGGDNADGYGDNEADGPYEESPSEQDNQNNLEQFFDDHLGASDKEGMDKENLPSIVRPVMVESPSDVRKLHRRSIDAWQGNNLSRPKGPSVRGDTVEPAISEAAIINYLKNGQQPFSSSSSSPELVPNSSNKQSKLTITRQIIHNPNYKGGIDLSYMAGLPVRDWLEDDRQLAPQRERMSQKTGQEPVRKDIKSSAGVFIAEDDDKKKIYVTRNTREPFKIDALGGFDPERAFRDATKDLEIPDGTKKSSPEVEAEEADSSRQQKQETTIPTGHVSFKDPEVDSMFNEATETDEVSFPQDDPYQGDLEADIKSGPRETIKNFDGINGQINEEPEQEDSRHPIRDDPSSVESSDADSSAASEKVGNTRQPEEEDESGSWINDGIDEMEVPSQAHQDALLEKAAASQEAQARAAAENGGETGSHTAGPEQESQPLDAGPEAKAGEGDDDYETGQRPQSQINNERPD